jgi:type II secretory pathway pseudopilin PulG
MVEIVVMLGILTFVSAILLTTFPSFNESGVLIRTQQELALDARKMQNTALAVANVEVTMPDGSQTLVIPAKVGMYFDLATPTTYVLFVDLNADNKYAAADDGRIAEVTLRRGLKFSTILNELGGAVSIVNIIFAPPDAAITVRNASGASIGGLATFEIQSPNLLLKRRVTVRTTGQIAVE